MMLEPIRGEFNVTRIVYHHEIGNGTDKAQIRAYAEGGGQKPGPTAYRPVGMRQIGQIADGQVQDVHAYIRVDDGPGFSVMAR